MQFAIDLAKKDYLLRTSPIRTQKEDDKPQQLQPRLEVSKLDRGAAFLAGAAITGIVNNLKQLNNKFFVTSLQKISNPPTLAEAQESSAKMLHDSGMASYGVKALFVEDTLEDSKKVSDTIFKNITAGFGRIRSTILEGAVRIYSDTNAASIVKGDKASYFLNEKCAITSKKSPQFIFHELGQAKVAEHSMFKPLLTAGKKLPYVAIALGFATMLYTPDKNKMETQKSKWEKTKDFFDNNIEEITLLSYMPQFAAKTLATHEGWKASKKYLPDAKVKSLRKLYAVGLFAFAATAFAAAVGINVGNKVQNNIIRQKNSPQDVYNLLI